MKKKVLILGVLIAFSAQVMAQCSLCTKTAQQLGEGPAKGLNSGILYLAITPLVLIAVLGYRWWRSNQSPE
ncbi:hypothetical protein KTO58_25210 [Chitinophaga pendula]|uniref:hypothetical protein n=1 Tax=Chitinophaga TaxID=79328 RepID=UPI000BAF348D|nr:MULTISPECIES: hypothetical protein [Chitinophaga]ASZ10120.1 hypothetical protein CK934_03560 [Chitinophaga sp. MD30]UCJ06925.1 hypothetical protein KTO58_25210 [Chitinophaga pendula]